MAVLTLPPISFELSPSVTACVASSSTCSTYLRVSASAFYTHRLSATRVFRVKLSREYQQTTDDSSDESIATTSLQAATGTLDLRWRTFDDLGYQRYTWHAGYQYQFGSGKSTPYHTLYLYDDLFFGQRILRGDDGPARQFDVVVKTSENVYQSSTLNTQTYLQLTPSVVFPIVPSGVWRAKFSYSLQQQFAGGGRLSPSSQRTTATLYYDPTPKITTFFRYDGKNTEPSAANPTSSYVRSLILSADIKF